MIRWLSAIVMVLTCFAWAEPPAVDFRPRVGSQVSGELEFLDSRGERRRLSELVRGRPLILVLGYYHCPSLCHQTQRGLLDCLEQMEANVGQDFSVVTVSIDPRDTPKLAAEKRRASLARYGRPSGPMGWSYLTGTRSSIQELCDAVGFEYWYDQGAGQYAHPSGLIILSPELEIRSYVVGIHFEPDRVEGALADARSGEPAEATVLEQVRLLCYSYDPARGRYSLSVVRVLRATAILTLLFLLAYIVNRLRQERP